MQATERRSWRISVHARANSFHFRFRGFGVRPNSSIGRAHFSVLLRIRRFFVKMVFQSGGHVQKPEGERSKLRFLRFFKRLNPLAVGNKGKKNRLRPQLEGLIFEDSMAAVIGGLALLSNSVAQMNYGGIALHVFTIFFYLILLFRNFSTRKIHFLLPLVATLACSIGFSLNYLNHKGLVSLAIWKAWNHLISFGCLYVLTQVIFSRLSPSMERNKLVGFLISALISFLPNVSAKWSWPSSRRKMAMEAATAPTWTADLLFSCQTFFHVLRNPRDPKALAVFISSARSLVKEMIRMWGPYLAA